MSDLPMAPDRTARREVPDFHAMLAALWLGCCGMVAVGGLSIGFHAMLLAPSEAEAPPPVLRDPAGLAECIPMPGWDVAPITCASAMVAPG